MTRRSRGPATAGSDRRLRRHDAELHRLPPCGGRTRSFCHRCRVVPRLRAACLARQHIVAAPEQERGRDRPGENVGDVAAAASLPIGLSCPYAGAAPDGDSRISAGEQAGRCRSLLDSLLRPAWPDRAAGWADALIERFGSLPATLSARNSERAQVTGALPARFLASVQASLVHGLRLRMAQRPIISTSKQLQDYLKADMANLISERFRVLFLTAQNELLADDLVWEGTVGEAPAYPREVVKRALEVGAAGTHPRPQSPLRKPSAEQGGRRGDPPDRGRRLGDGHLRSRSYRALAYRLGQLSDDGPARSARRGHLTPRRDEPRAAAKVPTRARD